MKQLVKLGWGHRTHYNILPIEVFCQMINLGWGHRTFHLGYNQFQPKQEIELSKCTQIVNLICQLVAELQKGRTCNSYLIRSFMSFFSTGQLITDKVILQFVHIFIVQYLNVPQSFTISGMNSIHNLTCVAVFRWLFISVSILLP